MGSTTATVFNIQKFSVNDGPGIRTTVFFKGCPLHCPWCSNPESQLKVPQVEWNAATCVACGHCLDVCAGVPASERQDKRHVDVSRLDAASSEAVRAVAECPVGALSVSGAARELEDVLAVCLQDRDFYEESGGGVTFSGGEMLLWADFVCELADRLHEEGVSTCAETTAYAGEATWRKVVSRLDHLLVDLKHWDADKHREVVGVPLEPIAKNIAAAVAAGTDVLVRIPVIPGFNYSDADAEGFAARLAELGSPRVQLLPYHNFGENKYALIGRDYDLAGVGVLHPEDLASFAEVMRSRGLTVII